MTNRDLKTYFEPGRGYSKEDWDDVSDNPPWTEEEIKTARPFAEVHPEWARQIAEAEENAAQNGLELVGVDLQVVARLQQLGPDWKKRMNDILRKAVGL